MAEAEKVLDESGTSYCAVKKCSKNNGDMAKDREATVYSTGKGNPRKRSLHSKNSGEQGGYTE